MESESEIQTLTDRQQRFVFEYLKDQNASAAAVRAGYSAKSRASQASELMQNPAIRERVRMEMQSLLAELGVSALDLMKQRMRAAFFRAGKLFDAQGRVLRIEELEAEVRDALVISIDWRRGEPVIRWRQPNREPALRALERVHERLEKLNEAYYEKLEREAQRAPAAFAEKPQVLSGSEQAPVNTFVFSDAPAAPNPPASFAFAEKPRVLSGSPQIPARPSVSVKAPEAFSSNKKEPAPVRGEKPDLPWRGAATELLIRGARGRFATEI